MTFGLALGWLLMLPPHQEVRRGSVQFDPKVPITKWTEAARYETDKACEQGRVSKARLASLDAPDNSWSELYESSRCIRAGDVQPAGRSE